MRTFIFASSLSAAFIATFATVSQAEAPNKPVQIFNTVLNGMPTDAQQELRVMMATMKPGEKSVNHTHNFPVTLYIAQGELTLMMKGKTPLTAKAGEVIVEEPGMETVAVNSSATEANKVIMFYASTPKTPFLVPIIK